MDMMVDMDVDMVGMGITDIHMPMRVDMMMFEEPPNWGSFQLNKVGKIYVVVFCLWTTIFAIGFVILWKHQRLPFIQLKNIPLVSWTLVFLHIQLSFDILSYPLNGTLACNLEYWVMALCLPWVEHLAMGYRV